MGIEIFRYTDLGLNDPIGVVGFPSVGLVSSILANYYVAQLEMTPIAGLIGSNMPPYSLINDGTAYSPIRMYGKKGRTKTARDMIICTSEYAPKPEDCYDISLSVLLGLRDLGCREIVCLEGIPRTTDNMQPVVFGNGPAAERMVEKSGLEKMENGMVKGISGIMMYAGLMYGVGVSTIMCPANAGLPDPGSAMGFIEPMSKIVRGLKVNTKALLEEAEDIRKRVEAEQESVDRNASQDILYG